MTPSSSSPFLPFAIGVGPMGFGARLSLIGCKITAANRLPTSFFVSVAYGCWGFRRLGVRLDATSGAVIYHCGPVMLKEGEQWFTKAAGPTTSIREEPYQAEVIRRYGLRGVIGKGGMGAKTLAGMKESGAVYLHAIGGAAQFYAHAVEKVLGVHLLEFGVPEAMWHLRVKDFLTIVTMDAHGHSLHAEVEKATAEALAGLTQA